VVGEPRDSLRRRAALDVVVQVVARVVNLVLGVVVTALLARTLGEAGFGQWATILLVYPLVGLLMDLGLTAATVREAASDPDNESEWVSALLVVQSALLVPAAIAAVTIVIALHRSHAMLVAGLILLAQLPLSLGGVVGTVFRIRMANTVPMLVLTLNSVLWAVAVLVIHEVGGGMVALALAMTATSALTTAIQAMTAFRLIRLRRPSAANVRRLVGIGTPLAVASMLVAAYGRIDQFLVFTLAGSRDAGLYSAMYRVLDSWAFLPGSLLTTLGPLLAASWPADRRRLLAASRLAAEYLTIGSLGILALVLATADPLVKALFGADFADAAPALPVLAGAFVAIAYGYLSDNLLLVLNLQRRLLVIALGGLCVNVAANALLIPPYGFMAAAWTTLGTELFVEAIAVWLLLRALDVRRPRVGRIGRIALAAGALAGALELLEHAGTPLVGMLAAAGVLYPAFLLAFHAIGLEELRSIILRRPVPA
jgi:O-antigen/teichoic acid export membrane protein